MTTSQAKIPTKPKGFNAITASISVTNVADAIAFYTDTLGAETVEILTVPGTEIAIYATIKVSGTTVVLNLDENAQPYNGQGQVTLHHYLEDVEAVFEKAVNNGAAVVSAITPTWWGDMTAILVDPFGVRWSLAQRAEQLNAEQRQARLESIYDTPEGVVATEVEEVEPAAAEAELSA
ncbi:glyoxalase/bleomycin resistance/extradiol dioxygenase family protein [Aliiroseovarius sp. PrR006]|uniref:VOC family protein n=1 Tax=Aliiroseovarius sp. PrR006 TaxID=2706883 RepID=UPI0013D25D29|nr:VOC family protein [Aliiroseovarius sp. PrR006]NDW54492.1 hypothetical protein [Aliiroseovarius sp. PrR006]